MHDEFTLLCERCGYVIEGLGPEGNCPECGKRIAESLPGARPGSPWQQDESASAWFQTASGFLRRPRGAWSEVSVAQTETVDGVLLINAFVAAASGAVLTVIGGLAVDPGWRIPSGEIPFVIMFAGLMTLLVWPGIVVLTFVEQFGVRTFGRLHGRRVTPAIAWTVVTHASFGWVVSGILFGGGHCAGLALRSLALDHRWLNWELVQIAPWLLPLLGFFAGLLVFETLTWLGVLNMHYANRARPDEQPPSDARTIA